MVPARLARPRRRPAAPDKGWPVGYREGMDSAQPVAATARPPARIGAGAGSADLGRRMRAAALALALTLTVAVLGSATGRGAVAADGAGGLFPPGTLVLTPKEIGALVFGERRLADVVALADSARDGNQPPWSDFRRAHVAEQGGDRAGAVTTLRAIAAAADPGGGVALWAWWNLRRLGERPAAAVADTVRGVVYEVPGAAGVQYVAVYGDGRWRIVRPDGSGLFWEETADPRSNTITGAALTAGQNLLPYAPAVAGRDESRPASVRATLLTWGGLRQLTLSRSLFDPGTPTRPIAGAMVQQLSRLVEFAAGAAGSGR